MARPNLSLASILLRGSRAGTPAIIRGQDAVDSGVMSPDGRRNLPGREVPGAGQFGLGTVTLPANSSQPDPGMGMDPGAIEPDPLPGADTTDGGGDVRGGGGRGPGAYPTNLGSVLGMSPIAGETWLGGRFLGIDPTTGKPIYDPLGYGASTDLDKYHAGGGPQIASNATGSYGGGSNNKKASGHDANYWVF